VVTVLELLLDPVAYHQQQVEVVGYFRFGREHVAIYASACEAFPSKQGSKASARGIWLVGPDCAVGLARLKALNRSTVRVTGTFINRSKAGAGHFGGWPAELRRITQIEALAA
jgi:hypothetical protein